jgi:glycosyltransferase involved in cell wall biosynthesis
VSAPASAPVELTVLVMTYNHARFIGQALDSALAQRTDFTYEILVSEDCSTDGTREAVEAIAASHPGKVRLLLSDTNLRSNVVVSRGIAAARGTYLAFLDGDDYWTDAGKLQKQVDFLRAHPQCPMCFHNARVEYEDGSRPSYLWTPPNQPPFSSFEDIWMGNFIPMCSVVFRRAAIGEVPAWYERLFPITDWPLHILAARSGAIGYLNEVMGVYRQHGGAMYSAYSEEQKQLKTLEFYRTMNANLDYRYDRLIRAATSKYFFEWAAEYERRGELAAAKRCFRTSLRARPVSRHLALLQLLKVGTRLYITGPRIRA